MREMISFKQELCSGCEICEIVCSMFHFGEIDVKRSQIRIERTTEAEFAAHYCRQCEARKCIAACEPEALGVSADGLVEVDRALCDGCGACSRACPFGSLPFDTECPLLCDACGGSYECVSWCPTKALVRRQRKK